jgi:NADPH2:quinone reductase
MENYMPRAVIGRDFGPPESYVLEEYNPGPPKAGELRIAVRVAGISYVDVLTAMGRYQFKPPLPFIPGSEYAGIVEALGEGVTGFASGDRVFGSGMGGIFSEASNFPASNVNHVPEGMALEAAAIFSVNYMTAYHALVQRGRAKPGETMLVLGAAGGTGFAAIQLGKYLGLRVIASASSNEKRAAALAGGADAVVTSGAQDWRDQVKSANSGRSIDIVFDPVGGDATELAFRTLGYDGRHLVVGFPAGIAALKSNLPLLKSSSLIGVHMRHFSIERPQEAAANRAAVLRLVQQGVVSPVVARRYRMEDYAAAMNDAFSGKAAGRIVLAIA